MNRIFEQIKLNPGVYIIGDHDRPSNFAVWFSYRGQVMLMTPTHKIDPEGILGSCFIKLGPLPEDDEPKLIITPPSLPS